MDGGGDVEQLTEYMNRLPGPLGLQVAGSENNYSFAKGLKEDIGVFKDEALHFCNLHDNAGWLEMAIYCPLLCAGFLLYMPLMFLRKLFVGFVRICLLLFAPSVLRIIRKGKVERDQLFQVAVAISGSIIAFASISDPLNTLTFFWLQVSVIAGVVTVLSLAAHAIVLEDLTPRPRAGRVMNSNVEIS